MLADRSILTALAKLCDIEAEICHANSEVLKGLELIKWVQYL
jgi:hypothetical protein